MIDPPKGLWRYSHCQGLTGFVDFLAVEIWRFDGSHHTCCFTTYSYMSHHVSHIFQVFCKFLPQILSFSQFLSMAFPWFRWVTLRQRLVILRRLAFQQLQRLRRLQRLRAAAGLFVGDAHGGAEGAGDSQQGRRWRMSTRRWVNKCHRLVILGEKDGDFSWEMMKYGDL